MRSFICLLILSVLLSCQKEAFESDATTKSEPEFYLEFTVSEPDPFGESVGENSEVIHCPQDLHFDSYVTEAREIFGVWYPFEEIDSDSLWLNFQLKFNIEGIESLDVPIDLIFLYKESKSKIQAIGEKKYTYKNKEHLVEKLRTQDWTNYDWNGFFSLMLFNVQLDNPLITDALGDHGFDMPEVNNNMFYYDWENFSFTNVHYSKILDRIIVQAEFDVSLKMLSCGFWNFVNINDARFQAIID